MPLMRYQIRNEFSLADSELYDAADRDDPEAILEGVAMAGLVGILRQLGDLAEFAAEVFHDLHEEVMTTAARGHGLIFRVQQLEAEFPSLEKAFLSQTNHAIFFSSSGVEWHPNLHTKQNLITRGDLPRCILDSYEECRGPPRLFLLDKYDIEGAGACLKRYTDPSFFKIEEASKRPAAGAQGEMKSRKTKKKGSRWKNGGTQEVAHKSNTKLHQLFLQERVDNGSVDPTRFVKLKKRQLSGSPLNLKCEKSYMEKFVQTPSPEHKIVCEISISPTPSALSSNNPSGYGFGEINKVSNMMQSPQGEKCKNVYKINKELRFLDTKRHQMDSEANEEELLILVQPIDSQSTRNSSTKYGGNMSLTKGISYSDSRSISADTHSDIKEASETCRLEDGDASSKELPVDKEVLESSSHKLASGNGSRVADTNSMILFEEACNASYHSNPDPTLMAVDPTTSSLAAFVLGETPADYAPLGSERKSMNDIESDLVDSSVISNIYCEKHILTKSSASNSEDEFFDGDESISSETSLHSSLNQDQAYEEKYCDGYVDEDLHTGYAGETCFGQSVRFPMDKHFPCTSRPEVEDCSDFSLLECESDVGRLHDLAPTVNNLIPEAEINSENVSQLGSAIDDMVLAIDEVSVVDNAIPVATKIPENASPIVTEVDDTIPVLKPYSKSILPLGVEIDDTKSDTEDFSEDDAVQAAAPTMGAMAATDIESGDTILEDHQLGSAVDDMVLATEEVSVVDKATPVAIRTSENAIPIVTEVDDTTPVLKLDSKSILPLGVEIVDTESDIEDFSELDAVQAADPNLGAIDATGVESADPIREDKEFSEVEDAIQESQFNLESKFSMDTELDNLHAVNSEDKTLTRTSLTCSLKDLQFSIISHDVQDVEFDAEDVVVCSSEQLTYSEELTRTGNDHEQMGLLSKGDLVIGDAFPHCIPYSHPHNPDLDNQVGIEPIQTDVDYTENAVVQDAPNVAAADSVNSILCLSSGLMCSPSGSLLDFHESSLDANSQEYTEVISSDYHLVSNETVQTEVTRTHSASYEYSVRAVTDDVQDSSLAEPTKNCFSIDDPTTASVDSKLSHLELETNFSHQILVEKSNDIVFSAPSYIPELRTSLEQPLVFQAHLGERLQADEACSKLSGLQSEQVQSLENEDGEICIHTSDESCPKDLPSKPSTLKYPEQSSGQENYNTKQVMDPFNSVPSAIFLPEATEVCLEEMPPLPPLPPMQWRMGKFQNFPPLVGDSIGNNQTSFPSISPFAADNKAQFSLGAIQKGATQPEKLEFDFLSQEGNIAQPNSENAIFRNFSVASQEKLGQAPNLLAPQTGLDGNGLPHFRQSSGGCGNPPIASMPPQTEVEDHPQIVSPVTEEGKAETLSLFTQNGSRSVENAAWPSNVFALAPSVEVGNSNDHPIVKQPPRPRSPLVDAVAAHDRSTLKKVSERVRPQIQYKVDEKDSLLEHNLRLKKVSERARPQIQSEVDEKDSLLEQIRAKSFNLKPAKVARPSIQGPKTNLKLVAILEKANAIRQATAGSDEDDDTDSWSDS